METQKDELWERLEKWQTQSNVGMSKDRYLEMMEQMGKDPDPEKCPPGVEDFPNCVLDAIHIFNLLGDRVYPDVGYIGKDYTNLPILMEIYAIDNVELLIETLSRLDNHAIKSSQEKLKREYDKIKSKNRVK